MRAPGNYITYAGNHGNEKPRCGAPAGYINWRKKPHTQPSPDEAVAPLADYRNLRKRTGIPWTSLDGESNPTTSQATPKGKALHPPSRPHPDIHICVTLYRDAIRLHSRVEVVCPIEKKRRVLCIPPYLTRSTHHQPHSTIPTPVRSPPDQEAA